MFSSVRFYPRLAKLRKTRPETRHGLPGRRHPAGWPVSDRTRRLVNSARAERSQEAACAGSQGAGCADPSTGRQLTGVVEAAFLADVLLRTRRALLTKPVRTFRHGGVLRATRPRSAGTGEVSERGQRQKREPLFKTARKTAGPKARAASLCLCYGGRMSVAPRVPSFKVKLLCCGPEPLTPVRVEQNRAQPEERRNRGGDLTGRGNGPACKLLYRLRRRPPLKLFKSAGFIALLYVLFC